ncbi:protein SPA1-RELATED 4 isoform X2 [Amborella trichopoda]|uniref:protein SPA1-RELATED 4 isoform X2 n=1 Tax=Amborella trichopoda TaxID=13333 RepID=UPI0009BD7140|nr:protein SPA1-RELATED 4 isoform X2 [Amborella trichopoda]|eukprot:XP_020520321.1 protein SPA1-RELATED 4 isoform X2 [Amborella trichopoda]
MEGPGEVNETVRKAAEAAPNSKRKLTNHSIQEDNCNPLEPTAVFIAPGNDWPESLSLSRSDAGHRAPVCLPGFPNVFSEVLDEKTINSTTSKPPVAFINPLTGGSGSPCVSPCSMNDDGATVEELTLTNYKGSQLGPLHSRKVGQWENLYLIAGGLGKDNSCKVGPPAVNNSMEQNTNGGKDLRKSTISPEFGVHESLMTQNYQKQDHINTAGISVSNEMCSTSSDMSGVRLPGCEIRTKMLSSSGFARFLVKNSLKEKGISYRHFESRNGTHNMNGGKPNSRNDANAIKINSDTSHSFASEADRFSKHSDSGVEVDIPSPNNDDHNSISLRERLKPGQRKMNKLESLHVFQQILVMVDAAHSRGVVLRDLRPSFFMVSSLNRVNYVGSYVPQVPMEFSKHVDHDNSHLDPYTRKKKQRQSPPTAHHGHELGYQGSLDTKSIHDYNGSSVKHQKLSEHIKSIRQIAINRFKAQNSGCDFREEHKVSEEYKIHKGIDISCGSNRDHQDLDKERLLLEERWYSSPEELYERTFTFSSDIYRLGVLLFELFSLFESWEALVAAMSDLRHRILPPSFLSENLKEAGFCLWLLHPEPCSRPRAREILQSELISEAQDILCRKESSSSIAEEDAISEELLHFVVTLQERRQEHAANLVDQIHCLEEDIEEVERRHSLLRSHELLPHMYQESNRVGVPDIFEEGIQGGLLSEKFHHRESFPLVNCSEGSSWAPILHPNEERIMKNIDQIEKAYFSMRSKIKLPEANAAARSDRDVLKNHNERCSRQTDSDESCENYKPDDRIGVFFDGLCKYALFSKFKVRATLRNGDLLNSANVICSLSFDRDEEYFASAGVSKKIKIFEFGSLLNDTVDFHYPAIEMSSESKLSCVCWNNYINNYLASTDYEGVVQLWDASTGKGFLQFKEHLKRAWSADFSQADPTKLASGSDDYSVKLWSINEDSSTSTIRNVANVCCVQFSPYSPHLLAFGSADYKVYCYDLRSTRTPWCTLAGHGKAVSYVKFVDSVTLVSSSTDNTLKLWDLNRTSASGFSNNACSLTFSGHTNEKNFVGLSVSDGYIACGSETNEGYSRLMDPYLEDIKLLGRPFG